MNGRVGAVRNCIMMTCYILSVNCQWSSWSSSYKDVQMYNEQCVESCGGAALHETRHKTVKENHGGTCSGATDRKTDCNNQGCIGCHNNLDCPEGIECLHDHCSIPPGNHL